MTSLFAYIILHMLMYAVNIYFWRCYRVNYPFIFGFKQGTELGYREVFLLGAGLTLLSLAGVLANLDMEMTPGTENYQTITELVPLGLVTLVLAIAFCPFNIIYRSSRFFFIKSIWRCICAPFYKVTLIDFFLADQLTSQVQAFRSLEFYICYYVWGDFRRRNDNCRHSLIDDQGLANIKQGSLSLETLNMSISPKVTHVGLSAVTNGAVSLRQLIIAYGTPVTLAMTDCMQRLPLLQSVKLDGCQLTCSSLKAIGNWCISLRDLSLSKCVGVMDDGTLHQWQTGGFLRT